MSRLLGESSSVGVQNQNVVLCDWLATIAICRLIGQSPHEFDRGSIHHCHDRRELTRRISCNYARCAGKCSPALTILCAIPEVVE